QGAVVAVWIDLEGLRVGKNGGGELALLLVLAAVLQRELRAGLVRLLLEHGKLLGDLRPARIELLGGLQGGDGACALAVLGHGEGVLIELPRGGDAGESLAAQEASAALAVAALGLLAGKFAPPAP